MTDHATTRRISRQRERKAIASRCAAVQCAYNRDRDALLASEPGEGAFMGLHSQEARKGRPERKNGGQGE